MNRDNDFNVAKKLFERGKYKKAALIYKSILGDEPKNAIAHQELARCLSLLKNYQEAEVEARRALELDAQLSRPYSVLGYIHLFKKEYKEAEALFRKAIEIDAQEAQYFTNLGLTLNAQGNFEDGLATLLKAESINPLNSKTHIALSFFYERQMNADLALTEAWKAFRLEPSPSNGIRLVKRSMNKTPLPWILVYIVVACFLFFTPLFILYSVPAIILSLIAVIIILALIVLAMVRLIRLTKIKRQRSWGLIFAFILQYLRQR